MAETPETKKPGLRNGFPIRDLGDGSIISGQANGEELVLGAEAMNPLPLAHFAPGATPCAVLGIMYVSVSGMARGCA